MSAVVHSRTLVQPPSLPWTFTNLGTAVRISDAAGELAYLTVGAKTVTVRGPSRTFTEQKRDFTDEFARTPSSEWGSSPSGGAWSSLQGNAGDYSISGGKALMVCSAANSSRYMRLQDFDVTTFNMLVTGITVDSLATGAAQSFGAMLYIDTDNQYRLRMTLNAGGTVAATIAKLVAGSETIIASAVTVYATWALSDVFNLRATRNAAGTLTLAVWRNADAEPAAQRSVTDATFTVGRLGLRGLANTGNTNLPTWSIDKVTVTNATWANPPVITHNTWVRVLPDPFTALTADVLNRVGRWLYDTTPDILAAGMEYVTGAVAITGTVAGTSGVTVSGTADYGPLNADGTRAEGPDFNDYFGVPWVYPASGGGSTDSPEAAELKCLDCSGLTRMMWGYRGGLPMTRSTAAYFDGLNLPRESKDQATSGPGVVIASAVGTAPALTNVRIGDVVFFDATNGGDEASGQIDHVGTVYGTDQNGYLRFISSRKTPSGPTIADLGAKSVIGLAGQFYSDATRIVRRF